MELQCFFLNLLSHQKFTFFCWKCWSNPMLRTDVVVNCQEYLTYEFPRSARGTVLHTVRGQFYEATVYVLFLVASHSCDTTSLAFWLYPGRCAFHSLPYRLSQEGIELYSIFYGRSHMKHCIILDSGGMVQEWMEFHRQEETSGDTCENKRGQMRKEDL